MPELSDNDIALLNRLARMVFGARGPNASTDGNSTIIGAARGQAKVLPSAEKWQWLKITGTKSGAGWYTARLQIPNGTATQDPTVDLSLSSVFKDLSGADDCVFRNLIEQGTTGGGHSITADGSQYVLARRSAQMTTGNSPQPIYEAEIGGSIGSGQYQFQSYIILSQNQSGWDFIRAHALIG